MSFRVGPGGTCGDSVALLLLYYKGPLHQRLYQMYTPSVRSPRLILPADNSSALPLTSIITW